MHKPIVDSLLQGNDTHAIKHIKLARMNRRYCVIPVACDQLDWLRESTVTNVIFANYNYLSIRLYRNNVFKGPI